VLVLGRAFTVSISDFLRRLAHSPREMARNRNANCLREGATRASDFGTTHEGIRKLKVPERPFQEPTRLILRYADLTIVYQENSGHLEQHGKSGEKSHISHETWPDLESAARAFWGGQVAWEEISES
jgi:hypothetical protein